MLTVCATILNNRVVAAAIIIAVSYFTANSSGCAQGRIVQYSSGQCSVNIANVSGDVHVEGGCLDQKVISVFLDTINRQQKSFEEKVREVEYWIKKYDDLSASMGAPGAFVELRKLAHEHLATGDLAGAGALTEQLISVEEKAVDQLARDYFNRAEIYVLQSRAIEAQPFYEKAFRYRPENTLYAEAYARNLCDTNQPEKARNIYEISVQALRGLVRLEPTKYAAQLSCTLVDLAGLYYEIGGYGRGLEIAQEALTFAKQIVPPDGKEAQERVADSLTSVGIMQFKLGNEKEAKDSLGDAEAIYERINVTNSNRPIVFDVLAAIAKAENDTQLEESRLSRAVDFERELTKTSPIEHRSKLAIRSEELLDFYCNRRDLSSADLVYASTTEYISSLPNADQVSVTFLSAVAAGMKGEVLLLRDDRKGARQALFEAIQAFRSVDKYLRTRETAMFSLAYDRLGWVNMLDLEFHSAVDYFSLAIEVNRYADGPQLRRALSDRRIGRFFVEEFAPAATDLVAHSDVMSEFDKRMWTFLIDSHTEQNAKISLSGISTLDDVHRTLVNVANGDLPISYLDNIVSNGNQDPRTDERCKLMFYVGELSLLAGDVNGGLSIMGKCEPTLTGTLYPWLMRAEINNWRRSRDH